MKTIKHLLTMICLLFFQMGIYSQISQPPLTALSPNAASLGLYGDIPVSYYTGTPEISIPLYDVKVSDFTLPISLNYHASGVQVDQRAGWTGVNWTLFAGGVITRVINGVYPDEYNNSNYGYGAKAGFYFNRSTGLLQSIYWNDYSYLRKIAQSASESLKDQTPDEFSFSFPGYNGKFYLDPFTGWAVQCDKPVKVEFDGNFSQVPFDKQGTKAVIFGYTSCFSGFTITTEDGTKYQFGKDINAIDFSMDFFGQYYQEWFATAWYLTKITLPNAQVINFTYERNEFINQMYIAVHHDVGSSTESTGGTFKKDPICSSEKLNSIEKSYEGQLISPVYLKEITTDNAVITFTKSLSNELKYAKSAYDEKYFAWLKVSSSYSFLPILRSDIYGYPACLDQMKWYKLDKITVQNKNKTVTLKTINFNYNNSATERLFLEKVTESGKSPYLLCYYSKEKLPGYLANKSDHWGYFNDMYATLNLDYLDYDKYYTYRSPNALVLNYGILNKIIYPTGGYTEFEYEPHTYRKQLNIERWKSCSTLAVNLLAGGLRIKQIKNSPTAQGPAQVVKEYYYVSDYLQNNTNASVSSGVLGGQVQYYFPDYTVYSFKEKDIRKKMSVFSSISVLPACQNINGSHIGYTEVIEKNPDNSFTRYQFSNFDNGYLDEPPDAIIQQTHTPYEHYASKAFERGKLLLQEEYNASKKKIEGKSIVYEKSATSNNFVRAMDARYRNVCPNTAVSYDEGTAYKIYTYLLRPKTETETFYDPATTTEWQSTVTNYTYNSKNLLSTIDFTRSDGKKQTTKFVYPFEITQGSDLAVMQKMVAKNILSSYVEKVVYLGTNQVIDGEYRKFSETKTNSGIFEPERIDRLPKTSITLNSQSSYYQPEMYYTYDVKGNIKESKSARDTVTTTYLWGYSYQYPIAKIENATYTDVCKKIGNGTEATGKTNLENIAAKVDLNTTDSTTINDLRTQLPNAQITTYTYKPLVGMTSMTNPNKIVTRYIYDSSGRLDTIKNTDNKTVSSYQYAYQNSSTFPLQVSITTSSPNYYGTSTTATAKVTGGSGKHTISWQLKDSKNGIIIPLSYPNAPPPPTGTSFSFSVPLIGYAIVLCTVTDNVTGSSISVSKTIECGYTPGTACAITMKSGYIPYNSPTAITAAFTGSVGKAVNISMNFYSTSSVVVGSSPIVGNINAIGRPVNNSPGTFDCSDSGRSWRVMVLPSGDIQCILIGGTAVPAGTYMRITGTYNIF